MKYFFVPTLLTALTLLLASCASELKEKQDMAAAAGFKVITPTKPEHVAMLPTLPKDKVSQITWQGKVYYVLPDAEHNQAWVGGPKQFEAYQHLRIAKQISDQNVQAAQMNQMAAMNWGAWGGWGGWGRRGWY